MKVVAGQPDRAAEFEIQGLPVGSGTKGGDAIALRYGNLTGSNPHQRVVVIDGGYATDGRILAQHIGQYFHTSRVDLVISTHPDHDHIAGLVGVLEELSVDKLLMHLPTNHPIALAVAKAEAPQGSPLSERLEKSLAGSDRLEAIARSKGIPIVEPFTGFQSDDGAIQVLGPTRDYYEQLLQIMGAPGQAFLLKRLLELAPKAQAAMVRETLDHETLKDSGDTTASNNSSVICLLTVGERRCLLTGDAGIPALGRAATELEKSGVRPGGLSLIQVPHHGSHRNVGPTILDRLVGPRRERSAGPVAIISAAKLNPDDRHPAKSVSNAFARRGCRVVVTAGDAVCYSTGIRHGWKSAELLPFYDYVEDLGDED